MTRKDTILIAVVINAGLLAILFATAMIYDTDKALEQTEFVTPVVDNKASNLSLEPNPVLVAAVQSGDEVDHVLKYYTHPSSPIVVETHPEIYVPEPVAVQSNAAEDEEVLHDSENSQANQFIEITVKRGDMLEKIARTNGTTIGAIKRANQLQSERLNIGQVLKIPIKKELDSPFAQSQTNNAKKNEEKKEKEPETNEPVYYVVKGGDNPWKIAKQFNVKFEDIVRLNHLDEEKARNLKVGDRIRVK